MGNFKNNCINIYKINCINLNYLYSIITLILVFSQSSFSQVATYGFSQTLVPYAPLAGSPTVAFASPWDNETPVSITVPFTFTYDGTNFTQVFISPNGFITLGTIAPSTTNYTAISDNTNYNTATSGGVISALSTDLISNGNAITYSTVGVSPNRTMVIEWNNAARKTQPGNFNFQIRLNETVNTIELSYGSCVPTVGTPNVTVQVGLRGQNNLVDQGNVQSRRNFGCSTIWLNQTLPSALATDAIITCPATYPDLGLNYKYTPSLPCTTPPTQPTGLVIGATQILNSGFVGNSFTAAVPAPTNYLILRSLSNVAPTTTDIQNRKYYTTGVTYGTFRVVSNSALTTFTQTVLNANTKYFYWVIPYNDLCYGAPFYNLTGIITASATTCVTAITAQPASSVGSNSFVANWAASATSGVTYFLDVATDSGFTTVLPGYTNLNVGTVTTFTINGLLNSTSYWYRVRAVGLSCGLNSNVINVTTICGNYTVPYVQNFDSLPIGVIPACFSKVNVNADLFDWQTQSLNFASASRSIQLSKSNLSIPSDDWFFLPNLILTGGVSYRLMFKYNSANTSGTFFESLKVRLGNTQTVAGMNITLLDLPNITNSFYETAIVDFTPVISGFYNIGFQGYSQANQSAYLVVDDISVTLSPNCFEPKDVNTVGVTSTTADVTWTAATPAPTNGYEYYVSTVNTPPTNATIASGSVGAGINNVTLISLLPSTYYYVWVRGNCNAIDKSIWSIEESFNTECTTPSITTSVGATRCGFGLATLSATPNTGSVINWFSSAASSLVLATGNNFTTPIISTTTTYFAEAKAYGVIAKVGPSSPINEGGVLSIQNFQGSVNFYVYSNTILQTIDIYPMVSGQIGQIVVRNSSNVTIATIPFTTTVSGGATPQAVPINYNFPNGTFNLFLNVPPAAGIRMNTSNGFYPYSSIIADIQSNDFDNTAYLGFYNWKFTTECLSGRIPITATVISPPAITLSAPTSVICQGFASNPLLVTGAGAYATAVWSPASGVSGNFATGFIFNPTTTTTYTLTATQTSGGLCGNQVTHTVIVNPLPSSIMIVPNALTICENNIQSLSGSSGSSSAIQIFSDNFNAPTTSWTVANTSFGGDTNASQWTLQNDGYHYISAYSDIIYHSNDNSRFITANADAQSAFPGTITKTTVTSPSFSLAGYTSAKINFWQYLRYVTSDISKIEISTDGGTNWFTIKTYTATQGTYSNLTKEITFIPEAIDLTPYLGNPNVTLRFNFQSNWGYSWAVDNIVVSGTLASALTWSPITDLYLDVLATVPYVANVPLSVVYVKPTATRTYTATLTGSNGCLRTSTALVTFNLATVAGTLSGSQDVCSGTSALPITVTGSVGSIIRWEYADDLLFTVNVTSIPNTTTTLTVAQMGTITTIRYFRAVVRSLTCSTLTTTPVYVTFPSTTWNGTSWSNLLPTSSVRAIFNGNYSSTSNIIACSVKINSGNVVFNANHSLIVTNEVTVSGGSLVFENNSSLVQINDASIANTGDITYKRNTTPIKKFDYTYWSSPVFPQTLVGLSPFTASNKYFYFDQVINNWVSIPSLNLMSKAKGYIIRAPNYFDPNTAAIFNASFIGTPNNGVITIPIVVSTGFFNLIGNPYPSALNIDAFLSNPLNTGVVDATVYLWTHNTPITSGPIGLYTSNDYAAYNYLGGTGTTNAINSGINNTIPTGKIASGQSFFIKGLSNNNVTFNNSMRVIANNDQFFRTSQNSNTTTSEFEKHRFWLDIASPEGVYKQTLIGYAENATLGIDRGYDGTFLDSGNLVNLYSLVGTDKLTIQGRPLPFSDQDEVPLGYNANIAGNYSINLYSFDNLFLNQNIYLKDNVLNVLHNLKLGAYTFATNSGVYNSRFSVIYQDTALGINNPTFLENNVVLYKPNKQLIVNSGNAIMKSIKIYDIRGRLILEKEAINTSECALTLNTTNEVLVVKITTLDLQTVTKRWVN